MILGFGFSVSLAMVAVATEGEGALEVINEPKVCVTEPCPQLRILGINGNPQPAGLGGDILNLETRKMPAGKPMIIIGTWTREENYFKIKAKEWMLNVHEKVEEKKND